MRKHFPLQDPTDILNTSQIVNMDRSDLKCRSNWNIHVKSKMMKTCLSQITTTSTQSPALEYTGDISNNMILFFSSCTPGRNSPIALSAIGLNGNSEIRYVIFCHKNMCPHFYKHLPQEILMRGHNVAFLFSLMAKYQIYLH